MYYDWVVIRGLACQVQVDPFPVAALHLELPDADQLSDQRGGHASFVTEDRPDSRLLICYQHIGSELMCIE